MERDLLPVGLVGVEPVVEEVEEPVLDGVVAGVVVAGDVEIDAVSGAVRDRLLLRVTAVLGSVHVVVPDHIDVDINGTALLGSITDRRDSPNTESGREVRIEAFALAGSVSVANKPIEELREEEEPTSIDEVADADVWRELRIPGSPFAIALDPDGGVLAKGTFNNLAQLESVLATAEQRRPGLRAGA